MVDLDRLRELAKEPERTAMRRHAGESPFPSMTDELLRQKQEIAALRRGLNEAIEWLSAYQARDEGLQRAMDDARFERRTSE